MGISSRKHDSPRNTSLAIFLLAFVALNNVANVQSIGVNYGTLGNNLPPPTQVAQFLKEKTTIDRIKIFDVNPDILQAFANTGILVAVTVPNGEIPNLTNIGYARQWVVNHIKPFHPQTKINYILVGNEILHWGPQNLIDNLVSAMRTLNNALILERVRGIKVSTAHSLGILRPSSIPGLARFRNGWDNGVLAPMLQFHRETKTPFMVNTYPYFSGFTPLTQNFLLFKRNKGVYDKYTKKTYGDMFDLLMDSVHMSMMRLGYGDVEIAVGETGWSSLGETFEQPKCSVPNAASYNGGLVRKYNMGHGTPLMPNRKIETYIFALFNENEKTGSLAERNFGLFQPDFSPVYDIGIMRGSPTPRRGGGGHHAGGGGGHHKGATPASGAKWCVAKQTANAAQLQSSIDYACSHGANCRAIQPGGACFNPNNLRAHASFAMNSYYQIKGRVNFNCDFSGTGVLVSTNPSSGSCNYN